MTKTCVIAEAGVNHNGSVRQARKLIDVAVEAGADVVKFQSFKTENVVTARAVKAAYQEQTTGAVETQFEMLQRLELSLADHLELVEHCRLRRIQFLSTPFDLPSVEFLGGELDMPTFKIASGEITNASLMWKIASFGRPIILSTGMSELEEVATALGVLAHGLVRSDEPRCVTAFREAFESQQGQKALSEHVTLLQCTTAYPTPFSDVNLRGMDLLGDTFGLPVGLSDHSPGIAVPIAAVARGARIVEKHFTLDRELPGPDHQASLEPGELVAMISGIRTVEAALGERRKVPSQSELVNRDVARRSLVAAQKINKGDIFDETNLTAKRPGDGVSPIFFFDHLGRTAEADYNEGDLIR